MNTSRRAESSISERVDTPSQPLLKLGQAAGLVRLILRLATSATVIARFQQLADKTDTTEKFVGVGLGIVE